MSATIDKPRIFGDSVAAARAGYLSQLEELLAGGGKAPTPGVGAKDEYGCDGLSWAARNDRGDVARFLAGKDADVESRSFGGMRPVHHACNSGNEAILADLLARGADVNATTDCGDTAAHFAAARGVLSTMQLLADNKADLGAKNANGSTPLHVACNNGQASLVAYLLGRDVEVGEADKHGNTPLHLAARCGFTAIIKALVAAGARNSPNRAGMTPAAVALDKDAATAVTGGTASGTHAHGSAAQ
jgi:ankyrin repeat protein